MQTFETIKPHQQQWALRNSNNWLSNQRSVYGFSVTEIYEYQHDITVKINEFSITQAAIIQIVFVLDQICLNISIYRMAENEKQNKKETTMNNRIECGFSSNRIVFMVMVVPIVDAFDSVIDLMVRLYTYPVTCCLKIKH